MSDWQPGDLALCVVGGKLHRSTFPALPEYPVKGKIYLVRNTIKVRFVTSGFDVGLVLDGAPLNQTGVAVWHHKRFIKVTPPEDMESETYEHICTVGEPA